MGEICADSIIGRIFSPQITATRVRLSALIPTNTREKSRESSGESSNKAPKEKWSVPAIHCANKWPQKIKLKFKFKFAPLGLEFAYSKKP